MDFGIARSAAKGSTQTRAGTVLGTLEYMAPEQARNEALDQRVDVYALGLIAYDMLVGRRRVLGRDNPMAEMRPGRRASCGMHHSAARTTSR